MAETNTKSLTLASEYDQISQVEPFVDELQEWIGFGDEVYGKIMMALSEAVTNAIVHGNDKDKSKKVYITALKKDQTLQISIQDEGEGFDPESVPDPLKDENLLKQGGRGVYLIEQYADEVSYSKGGTKITIEFLL